MDGLQITDWLAILSAVSMVIVLALNVRNLNKPKEDLIVRLAKIEAGIEGIQGRLDRIQNSIGQIEKNVLDLEGRVAKVEESTRSAHKRIDDIVKGGHTA